MSASGYLITESDQIASYGNRVMSSMRADVIYGRRAPDRVARSAIARSGVQHKTGRAAAQFSFLQSRVPDLRAGKPALVRNTRLCDVTYGTYGGNVIYACGPPSRHTPAVGVETS